MTDPSLGPDGATPVDRRWFEEALRSQGFVAEPPAEDVEAEPSPETGEPSLSAEPSPSTETSPSAEPDVPIAAPTAERPPVPSALLARIAARGQPASDVEPPPGATPVAEPEMVAAPEPDPEMVAEPEPEMVAEPQVVAAPEPEPVPTVPSSSSPEAEPLAPWASAVVAPIAPWSSPAEPTVTAQPDEPDPVASPIEVVEDVEPTSEMTSPEPEPKPEPGSGFEAPTAGPGVAAVPSEPTAPDVPPAAPSPVLESPYNTPVVAATAAAAQPRTAVQSTVPDASEGELWALVGASEPAATPATGSEAARVVLTILTAFLILVIVVGSLVLASQIG
ncbi:MAG: hypothetical protein ABWZ82_09145 [Candidatus Limnocylindrales bacterium]